MITFDEFKKMDLRIAEVLEVSPHPNADKLYVLKVRVGEETRTLVAGVRPYYKEDELKGKKIVVVWNLQPTQIRGIESQGMLLAARGEDKLGILTLDREIPSGSKIS